MRIKGVKRNINGSVMELTYNYHMERWKEGCGEFDEYVNGIYAA